MFFGVLGWVFLLACKRAVESVLLHVSALLLSTRKRAVENVLLLRDPARVPNCQCAGPLTMRRARMSGSYTFAALIARLEIDQEEEEPLTMLVLTFAVRGAQGDPSFVRSDPRRPNVRTGIGSSPLLSSSSSVLISSLELSDTTIYEP